jgi:hypothetical protein
MFASAIPGRQRASQENPLNEIAMQLIRREMSGDSRSRRAIWKIKRRAAVPPRKRASVAIAMQTGVLLKKFFIFPRQMQDRRDRRRVPDPVFGAATFFPTVLRVRRRRTKAVGSPGSVARNTSATAET